ncbi:MAG: PDDEXK nuclease domain-containing protein [Bacteroidota bacterium]
MDFEKLVYSIQSTSNQLQQSAIKAVNIHLTIRNWLIGYYIVTFEQQGEDRARYGAKLLQNIATTLNKDSFSYRNLKLFRQFFIEYPQIGQTVSAQLKAIDDSDQMLLNQDFNDILSIRQTLSAQLDTGSIQIPPEKLLAKLSFSHFSLLMPIKDNLKRVFYEMEVIKGTWSVNELKRQINSLYFERCEMSLKPEKLSEITQEKSEQNSCNQIIKTPFVFEFLGLKAFDVIEEKDLESALISHLQEFLLELGDGFCFEARQKRILIDEEYYFVDLVFYHRILKCHVLIELKTDVFKSEYASKLNTYVAYYNDEIKLEDDNPTIGILLCTEKGKKLVDYALAGMDKNLFVSKYLVELPTEQQFVDFIMGELKNI